MYKQVWKKAYDLFLNRSLFCWGFIFATNESNLSLSNFHCCLEHKETRDRSTSCHGRGSTCLTAHLLPQTMKVLLLYFSKCFHHKELQKGAAGIYMWQEYFSNFQFPLAWKKLLSTKKTSTLRVWKLSWWLTVPGTLRKWLDLNSGQVARQLSPEKHSWCRRDERLPPPTGPALPAEGTHFS